MILGGIVSGRCSHHQLFQWGQAEFQQAFQVGPIDDQTKKKLLTYNRKQKYKIQTFERCLSLLISLILNKPQESLIDKSKNLNITIDKLTRIEKHVHFKLAHNQPLSKLQIRISNKQSLLWKGTNKHLKKPDIQNNVWDVNLKHSMA